MLGRGGIRSMGAGLTRHCRGRIFLRHCRPVGQGGPLNRHSQGECGSDSRIGVGRSGLASRERRAVFPRIYPDPPRGRSAAREQRCRQSACCACRRASLGGFLRSARSLRFAARAVCAAVQRSQQRLPADAKAPLTAPGRGRRRCSGSAGAACALSFAGRVRQSVATARQRTSCAYDLDGCGNGHAPGRCRFCAKEKAARVRALSQTGPPRPIQEMRSGAVWNFPQVPRQPACCSPGRSV